MADPDLTLPFESLHKWAIEFETALERADTRLKSPDVELEEIRQVIDDRSSLFKTVEKLIEHHEVLVRHAKFLREQHIRGHGMASLPVEIVRWIFRLACGCSLDSSPCETFTNTCHRWTQRCHLRFNIAHVTRYWREIALSIPQLWSTILISSSSPPDLLSFLAQKSGLCPLNIRLEPCLALHDIDTSNPDVDRLIELYLPLSSRCRELCIACDEQINYNYLLKRLAGPSLRKICLEIGIDDSLTLVHLNLPAIDAPNVSTISVHVPVTLSPLLAIQLTALELKCHPEHVLPTLASCPNLYRASFKVPPLALSLQPFTSHFQTNLFVRHESLKVLCLDFSENEPWTGILNTLRRLTAPVLETLILSPCYGQSRLPSNYITSTLDGTNEHPFGLTSVTTFIYACKNDHGHHSYLPMLNLLSKFSNVERLECEGVRLQSLQRTFRTAHRPPVPPRLRTLVLHSSRFTPADGVLTDPDRNILGAAHTIGKVLDALNGRANVQVMFEGTLADHGLAIRQEMNREKAGEPLK